MKKTPLSTVIVGCGRIGAQADAPGDTEVRTHAHAVARLPDLFSLGGFVDPSPEALAKARAKWGGEGAAALAEYTGPRPGLVVIASPDACHAEHLRAAWALGPRAILVEKPVATDGADLPALMQEHRARGVPVAVNYTRRYMPALAEFLRELEDGQFGRFLHGSGIYAKGLFHTASHLLNLILPLVDRPLHRIDYLGRHFDYGPADPSVSATLRYTDGSYFHLRAVDATLYELFEIDLLFEKARVRVEDLGYSISYFAPEVVFPATGIRYVTKPSRTVRDSVGEAFLAMYRDLAAAVETGREPRSAFGPAVRTLEICESLHREKNGF